MAARDKADAVPAGVVIVGLLPDPDAAANAIRQLKDAGFTNQEVGAIMRKRGPTGELLTELVKGEDLELEAETTKTGAATGGIIGGLLGLLGSLLIPGLGPVTVGGVLASTLVGAGAGAVAGGLIGMLLGMGLSRAEAEYFDRAVRGGGVLVTVQPAPARAAEARSILQDAGADLGPAAAPAGAAPAEAAAGGGRKEKEEEPWRGNERRYHQDANFAGPERRKAPA
jgi:hypothetical protein